MKYYVDSDNWIDNWKEFNTFEEAKKYFDELIAKNKIMYDENMFTVLETHND